MASRYALVHNNNIKVGPREWHKGAFQSYLDQNGITYTVPVFYNGDDPILINIRASILPVYYENTPSLNSKIEQAAGPFYSIGEDRVTASYTKVNKPIEMVKNELKTIVNNIRPIKETAGITYSFNDGDGKVQLRDERDFRNIMAISAAALALKANNVTDPVVIFRDEADVTHSMTPDEAIAFGMHVQQAITDIYKWSWDKKAEIDACTTLEELNNFVIIENMSDLPLNTIPMEWSQTDVDIHIALNGNPPPRGKR